MKRILTALALSIALASPANAQLELPDRFFIECDKSFSSNVLILADRNEKKFFIKLPYLREEEFKDTLDGLETEGTFRTVFNKWDGSLLWDMELYRDCKILDPESRQPLFR